MQGNKPQDYNLRLVGLSFQGNTTMLRPHYKYFWGYWHVYLKREEGLIGAAKTIRECQEVLQRYLRQKAENERKSKKRTAKAPRRRTNPRSHRSK